jgi:hypothetical protein
MVQFQSIVFAVAHQPCARNATIPLIALSSKSPIIPELRCLSRVATPGLCLFCRKYCDFRLIFGQMRWHRRIAATVPPSRRRKYGSQVNAPVIKRLPESS